MRGKYLAPAAKPTAEDFRRVAKGAILVLWEGAETSPLLKTLAAGDLQSSLQITASALAGVLGLSVPRETTWLPQTSQGQEHQVPSVPSSHPPLPVPTAATWPSRGTTARPTPHGFAASADKASPSHAPQTPQQPLYVPRSISEFPQVARVQSDESESGLRPQDTRGPGVGPSGAATTSAGEVREGAAVAAAASPPLSPSLSSSSSSSPSAEGAAKEGPGGFARRQPRERRVPASPLSRGFMFAGLGAGMALGALQEVAKRVMYGAGDGSSTAPSSLFLSEANAERLAAQLCRARGAALKIGQMLSIQDEGLLPPQIAAALERVRNSADVMPRRQLHRVMAAEWGGREWRSRVREFDDVPIAAASIGQVHRAVLHDGREVAVKVQFPGVAQSIDSDIDNLRLLLDFTNIVPRGLFLSHAIQVAKMELAMECDYLAEAQSQRRFKALVADLPGLNVPAVIDDLCTRSILTTELVNGVSIDRVADMDRATRDYVGRQLLLLTVKELFEFHFMQTDPNWGNFLFDEATGMLHLIDFGAARAFPRPFVREYLRMVRACADKDREGVLRSSLTLGFLTGEESESMLRAHTEAAFVVGLPFAKSGGYDFGATDLTRRVSALRAMMLRERLTPPPDEAYSLHRKLSGAFLACIKLRAIVPCREILLQAYDAYDFSESAGEKE